MGEPLTWQSNSPVLEFLPVLYIYGVLRPTPRLTWRFHVAPLLIDRIQQKTYVLDPSLANAPVSADE